MFQGLQGLKIIGFKGDVLQKIHFIGQVQVAYSFKLNLTWLAETDFDLILKEVWKDVVFLEESDIQNIIDGN